MSDYKAIAYDLLRALEVMPQAELVEALNEVREALHNISPFKSEPVDFVKWVPSSMVGANDYNPNTVAPPKRSLGRSWSAT